MYQNIQDKEEEAAKELAGLAGENQVQPNQPVDMNALGQGGGAVELATPQIQSEEGE